MHYIQIVVAGKSLVSALPSMSDKKSILDLGFGLSILPIEELDVSASFVDADDLLMNTELKGLSGITSKQLSVLKSFSNKGLIAYLETEYFGGTGCQASLLLGQGDILEGPYFTETIWDEELGLFHIRPPGEKAINRVLKSMGVVKNVDMDDEFEALGLIRFRSNRAISNECKG
ncbi:MAG: hypothetical protein AAGF87_01245 [Bacteroidota bacterium]